jgi:hypothetical protein
MTGKSLYYPQLYLLSTRVTRAFLVKLRTSLRCAARSELTTRFFRMKTRSIRVL